MVQFIPLDLSDPESINFVLSHIDNAIQYGESEVRSLLLFALLRLRELVIAQEPKVRRGVLLLVLRASEERDHRNQRCVGLLLCLFNKLR